MGWNTLTVMVERLHGGFAPSKKLQRLVFSTHSAIRDLKTRKWRLLSGPSHKKQPPSLEKIRGLTSNHIGPGITSQEDQSASSL